MSNISTPVQTAMNAAGAEGSRYLIFVLCGFDWFADITGEIMETGNAFPLEVSPSDSEAKEILLQKFISKSTVYSKLVQRKGELQT